MRHQYPYVCIKRLRLSMQNDWILMKLAYLHVLFGGLKQEFDESWTKWTKNESEW